MNLSVCSYSWLLRPRRRLRPTPTPTPRLQPSCVLQGAASQAARAGRFSARTCAKQIKLQAARGPVTVITNDSVRQLSQGVELTTTGQRPAPAATGRGRGNGSEESAKQAYCGRSATRSAGSRVACLEAEVKRLEGRGSATRARLLRAATTPPTATASSSRRGTRPGDLRACPAPTIDEARDRRPTTCSRRGSA